MDNWDENRYKRIRAQRVFLVYNSIYRTHVCCCKHEKNSMPSTKLDKVFVDYITAIWP